MDDYISLQEELIRQKELIEKMSGTVTVANSNPSPYEITSGIESIPSVDLSNSTATEADVKQGKTFYSGNAILKTGTALVDQDEVNALFAYNDTVVMHEEKIYYALPDYVKTIRKYDFYKNYHEVEFAFGNDLQLIDEYAFYETKNFTFVNFNDLTNLKQVGHYSFAYSKCGGMNIGRIPDCVKTVNSYTFAGVDHEYLDIKFPDNLEVIGQYVYMATKRLMQNTLDLTNYKLTMLQGYEFYNQAFNCDLDIPDTVKTIHYQFDYNGCFKNITIPASVTQMQNYCFGASSSMADSDFYLKTVVFEGETPPQFGNSVFARQNINNGFKIYVPDTAVEAYKAANNFSEYVNVIYPMSERP